MTTVAGGRRSTLIIVALCALSLILPAQTWSSPEYRAVTILHTNDTHGHLIPFSYPDAKSPGVGYASMPFTKDIGGIARRATLARQIEDRMRGNVLFLDAGDALDGTPFSIEYMGEADFAAMSVAGYDASVPGNHEFSATIDEFHRNVRTAGFPVVSANVIDRASGRFALPRYNIFDVDGAKIAVFGLTIPNTYTAAQEGMDIRDPIETAREIVPELRKQADIVVALTHIGFDQDQRLAKEVPGIDVIVGGHSHTRLAEPFFIPQTDDLHAFWVGGTVIVQGYQWGGELGRLDLRLRRDGGPFTLMSYSGQLLPVTSDIPRDPATARVVDRYYRPLEKYYGQTIGEAAGDFCEVDGEDTTMNLVCDALRESTGMQIGIYNFGGVRDNIVKGPIKVWDVANVLPFRNKLLTFEVSGARLKQALVAVRPGVSGLRYHVKGGKLIEATVGGKPIQDDAVYTVASADYLSGVAFGDIKEHKVVSDDYRTAVIDYIKARGTVTPVKDGRCVVE